MALTPLDIFKKHVNADDFADDDALLALYLDAAEQTLLLHVGRDASEMLRLGGGALPPDFQLAVMFLAANAYHYREPVSAGTLSEVPYTLGVLLKPYVRLT